MSDAYTHDVDIAARQGLVEMLEQALKTSEPLSDACPASDDPAIQAIFTALAACDSPDRSSRVIGNFKRAIRFLNSDIAWPRIHEGDDMWGVVLGTFPIVAIGAGFLQVVIGDFFGIPVLAIVGLIMALLGFLVVFVICVRVQMLVARAKKFVEEETEPYWPFPSLEMMKQHSMASSMHG